MAVVPKKAVTKTTKPKAPPKPKFGELNYEFKVTAKIVEVNPEEDDSEYPFVVSIDLGKYDDWDGQADGSINFMYGTKKSFLSSVSKHVPALSKQLKLEELAKAKAEVVRLTKELAAIK